ncbi:MAG: site-specific DNA-methyltransferase [Bacteroidetes bacterium]|nr:MAG: site-specific DNA-methyltransferase [Bacteroidota bacterium]
METMDGVQSNIEKIRDLFPSCVVESRDAEGRTELKVDFERLRAILAPDLANGDRMRYRFTWPDKHRAFSLIGQPIRRTLRPCRGESVDFDATKNLYIEGDNLEVLKCLQETYLGRVKMIYIDPPYNTGHDFVYRDDYRMGREEFEATSGLRDEEWNCLRTNEKSNGRFHTDWLNMMYPRLYLAHSLLREDGVIFISIDDNEVTNLRKLCDEVFGEGNFVAIYKWNKTSTPPALSAKVRTKYEFVLCYEKSRNSNKYNGGVAEGGDMPLLNSGNAVRSIVFPKESVRFRFEGRYLSGQYDRVFLHDVIEISGGYASEDITLEGPFKWTQETVDAEIAKGTTFVIKTDRFAIRYERLGERVKIPSDIISKPECGVGTNEDAAKEVKSLFGSNIMSYPKPVSLVSYLSNFTTSNGDIILDFFSGSATTAHAVMELNAADGGDRRYIMVQIPEATDETSEAFRAGYPNICEIGKERIRRAGVKVLEEYPGKQVDVGFRVLKLDSSNMQEAYYRPSEQGKSLLDLVDTVVPGRTDEDLLFQAMLELGIPLDERIERLEVGGNTLFNVGVALLVACFDGRLGDEALEKMVELQPGYAVVRDRSGQDGTHDRDLINCRAILKDRSSRTVLRIL